MLELVIFISCGAEVEGLRDVAARVLRALENAFLNGLKISVVIRNWDYRDESPEVVKTGEFSARSLRMVDSSNAVIGILGPSVPPVTALEILRAIERFATGDADNVWLFVDASTLGPVHARYLGKIKRKTGMEVVYQKFMGDSDFQEKLFVALIPYVVRKTILERQNSPTLAPGGAA